MRLWSLETRRNRALATLLAAGPAFVAAAGGPAGLAYGQRVIGLDTSSAANGTAPTQSQWDTAISSGYRFAFVRASRGGLDPVTQARVDDAQFYDNITRATAAGLLTGSYHFMRADLAHRGDVDAQHYLEQAGMYMKPGYLLPVADLESGNARTAFDLTNWALEFVTTIEAQKGITPLVYSNSSYANDEVLDNLAFTGSTPRTYHWLARPGSDINTGSPPPASQIPNPFGIWDPEFVTRTNSRYPAVQPWAFWQQQLDVPAANTPFGFKVDYDAANGNIEFVKDFLVPALWTTAGGGTWGTLANWNSDNPLFNGTPAGGPAPRLPNGLDWVKLQNPLGGTVTISGGAQSVRKLYTAQPLNITTGSLSVGYVPGAGGKWDVPAEFAATVTLGGVGGVPAPTYSAHTTQVNGGGGQFNVNSGTANFDNINLASHNSAPGKLVFGGDATLVSFTPGATAVIRSTGGLAQPGTVDLGSSKRALTVPNGTASVDVAIKVSVTGAGSLAKLGAGTLQLAADNTYTGGTNISDGTLRITRDANLGTAPGAPQPANLVMSGGRLQTGSQIDTITLTNPGSGFTSFPTLTIGGAGPDAVPASANVLAGITDITVTSGGSNYGPGAFVTLVGGGGTGATAQATIDASGVITGITITNPGTGYTSLPTVHISGPRQTNSAQPNFGFAGSGAAAVVSGISLQGIALNDAGFDYAVPSVTISGGGGVGAAAAATSTPNWALAANRGLDIGANGADLYQTAGSTLTYAGVIATTGRVLGQLTKSGPGTLILGGANTFGGGTTVSAGTLVAANGDALGRGGLTVNDGALARAEPGLPKALSVSVVTTSGTGSLDLTNNDLVVTKTTLAAVQALIAQGFNGGSWNGGGINSSAAATNANATTALGYASNGELALSEFSGVTLTGTSLTDPEILVKYTHYGDADLTGVVDLDDFGLFLTGYQNPATTPRTWLYGDFDYTGVIDLDDFGLFLYGYQNQGGPLSALAEVVADASGVSAGDRALMQAAISAVPEPAFLGGLGLAGVSLLRRGRRLDTILLK